MEIGLYAESAGLASLDKTLPRARDLGITRIELSTGGQNPQPFLDVDALPKSAPKRLYDGHHTPAGCHRNAVDSADAS